MCALTLSGILLVSNPLLGNAMELSDADSNKVVQLAKPYEVTDCDDFAQNSKTYQLKVEKEEMDEIVVPVAVSGSGLLSYQMVVQSEAVSKGSITVTMFEDKECKKKLEDGEKFTLSKKNKSFKASTYIKKEEIYYMKIVFSKATIVENGCELNLYLQHYSNKNQTLKDKKALYGYQNGKGTSVYYKIAVKKAGIITIDSNFYDYEYGTPVMVLCNEKKKAVSAKSNIAIMNSSKVEKNKQLPKGKNVFVVSKGTYLVKLTDAKGKYKIMSTFSGISEKSGKSKAKATSILLEGKEVEGTILASDKTSTIDWYKFRIDLSSKIDIKLKGSTVGNGKLTAEIVPPKTAIFKESAKLSISGVESEKTGKSSSHWPSGTYYIKVYKTKENLSGNYSIKIKTIE